MNLSVREQLPRYSPADVASQVDVVFTNLPDFPDVEKVALGEEGIIEGARKSLIFVDNSTIKRASARMIAEKLSAKGVLSLDAPFPAEILARRTER